MKLTKPTSADIAKTSLYPIYKIGQTEFSKRKTEVNAITFEVQDDKGNRLKEGWTHGQEDSDLKGSDVAIPDKFLGTTITLPLYPTEITRTQPIRTNVVQSPGFSDTYQPIGIIDNWGMGLPKWTIRGHTGWGTRRLLGGTVEIDGYMAYVALYNFFVNYQKENFHRIKSEKKKPKIQLALFNWSDSFQDFWYVEPLGLPTKIRNAGKPLYYQYELNLIGIKPFVWGDKTIDPIAQAVGDNEARIITIHGTLKDKLIQVGEHKNATYIPKYLQTTMGTIIVAVEDIRDVIAVGVSGVKTFLTKVDNTITDITDFVDDLKDGVRDLLSPVFELIHLLVEIKCGLQTLTKIPMEFYSELVSDISNLVNALKSSGCGTTLRAGGLGSGKYGWKVLQ